MIRPLICKMIAAVVVVFALMPPAYGFSFCLSGDPPNFNPADNNIPLDQRSWARLVYDRLVEMDENGAVTPSLAESWEITKEGKAYIFKLRQGVSFHNYRHFTPSRYFNADDVLFTFNRLGNDTHPQHRLHNEDYSKTEQFFSNIRAVERRDDYTVVFHLEQPSGEFLAGLSRDFASILSSEYARSMNDIHSPQTLDEWPIGTGAYQMIAYYHNLIINLRSFEKSWHEYKQTNNILLIPITDEAERVRRLKATECDMIPAVDVDIARDLAMDKKIKIVQGASNEFYYLAYNTTYPPLDSPNVRQGLNYAVNKDAIIKIVMKDRAIRGVNPLPYMSWAYNQDIKDADYSSAYARELVGTLSPNRRHITLWLSNKATKLIPDPNLLGEVIKAGWTGAGFDVDIVYTTEEELLRVARSPRRPGVVLLKDQSFSDDPDDIFKRLLKCDSPNNYAHWCNKFFERVTELGANPNSQDDRKRIYDQAQSVFQIEMPWTVLAYPITLIPTLQEVEGFRLTPLGYYDLSNIRLNIQGN